MNNMMVLKEGESPSTTSRPASGDDAPIRVFSEEAHGNVVVDDCLATLRRLESDPESIVIFISGCVGSRHKNSRGPQCSVVGVFFGPSSPANISERLPSVFPKEVPAAELYALKLALQNFLWYSRNDANLWRSPNPVMTERVRGGISVIVEDPRDNARSTKDDIKFSSGHIESNENSEMEPGDPIEKGAGDKTSETDSEGFPECLIDRQEEIEPQEKTELQTDADMREALHAALRDAVQGAIHRQEDREFQENVERIRAEIQDEIDLFGGFGNVCGKILDAIDKLREMCSTQPQAAPTAKRFGISRMVIVTECEEVIDTFCKRDLKDLLKGPSRKALRKGKEIDKGASRLEALKETLTAKIGGKRGRNGRSIPMLVATRADVVLQLTAMYKLQNYKAYKKEMERVQEIAEASGRTLECERSLVELKEDICKAVKAVEKLCPLEFWLVEEDTIHDARNLAKQAFSSKHVFGVNLTADYERLENLGHDEERNMEAN